MTHSSSTQEVPAHDGVPRHVAIIMDGNGPWAKRQPLPRIAGHRRGVESVRAAVRACAKRGIEFLTLFAFSSENWRRPAENPSASPVTGTPSWTRMWRALPKMVRSST